MHCRSHPACRVRHRPSQVVDPASPACGIAIVEASLFWTNRRVSAGCCGVESAAQVKGVEQGQPDPNIGRSSRHRDPHCIGIVVGASALLVVQVVELADHPDSGECHFREDRTGQPVVVVGVKVPSNPIHQVAPSPERAPLLVGAAPQCSMKGMAVCIGERRDRYATELSGIAGRRGHFE